MFINSRSCTAFVAIVVASSAITAGCTFHSTPASFLPPSSPAQASPAEPIDPILTDAGMETFGDSKAEDWVTFADYLVTIRIDAERRLPREEGEADVGEGIQVRQIDATITSVLWRRPTSAATDVPKHASWPSGGWVFKGAKERPIRVAGAAWLVVGGTYLMPLTYMKFFKPEPRWEWTPMTAASMLPFEDGVIGKGERIPLAAGQFYDGTSPGPDSVLRDAIWGRPAADLVDTLNETEPYPEARPFMDQDPLTRLAAVQRSAPQPSKGPGER